jgi:hypothetical protein
MALITGSVRCISVSDIAAFTTIRDAATATDETLILWFAPGSGGGTPPDLTSFTRILHSMWISLLRDAHANNLTVTVVHPNNSAAISSVRLGTF